MSEYQYYGWQTLDRPLTAAERAAVAKLSSHIEVSATHAGVEYHWGDFKHDPIQVLARYFDAFQYYANWGAERLAFRFPRSLLDTDRLEPYLWTDCADLQTIGDSNILHFSVPEEDEPLSWDGEGVGLDELSPLRADILQGDLRSLYLASLLGIVAGVFPDDEEGNDALAEMEPQIPPGLGQLTPALEAFVRFLHIDPFLVQAAAEASPSLALEPSAALDAVIAQLPRAECDSFLQRLLQGEANLQVVLRRRLQDLAGGSAPVAPVAPRRTIGELLERAEQLRHAATKRGKAAAEAKRVQELQAFATQAARAWQTVEEEIGRKNASGYDNAVQLLVKLRDLAVYQGELPLFKARIATLVDRYKSQRSFVERVGKAKL